MHVKAVLGEGGGGVTPKFGDPRRYVYTTPTVALTTSGL